MDEVENDRNLFRQRITESKENPNKHLLFQQINKWEEDSIKKIKQTAEEMRQCIIQYTSEHITEIEIKLTDELRDNHKESDFIETDLDSWKNKSIKLDEKYTKTPNISIQQDSISFIRKISVRRFESHSRV